MDTSAATVQPIADGPDVPRRIGSPPESYAAALKLLERFGARHVLDCPSGEGAFAKELLDAGYETTCCDIVPDRFKLSGQQCDYGDLNVQLPYDSNEFDAITCLNGFHRVWARGRAMFELARVLKPGGHLILTFVNNTNLIHRLTYCLTGSVIYNTIGPPHVCHPDEKDPASCFRYPMSVAHLAAAMNSTGLEWGSIQSIRPSLGSFLLAPFAVVPLLFLPFAPKRYRDSCFLELQSNRHVLFGDFLAVWGRKPSAQRARNGA